VDSFRLHPNELPLNFSKEQFSRAEIVEDRQEQIGNKNN
jgi:hypothetical protein